MKRLVKFFNREQNLLIHIIAAITVIIFGIKFNINQTEWLLVSLAIIMVITSELLNSAIELTVDLYTRKYNDLAKVAKDTAAAAVLVSAITSVFIGAYVFLPKCIDIFSK